MKFKYITIRLNTASNFKRAERLKDLGWKIISAGWDDILLEKAVN